MCFFAFFPFLIVFPWDAAGGCAVQGAEFSHCGTSATWEVSSGSKWTGRRWDTTAP